MQGGAGARYKGWHFIVACRDSDHCWGSASDQPATRRSLSNNGRPGSTGKFAYWKHKQHSYLLDEDSRETWHVVWWLSFKHLCRPSEIREETHAVRVPRIYGDVFSSLTGTCYVQPTCKIWSLEVWSLPRVQRYERNFAKCNNLVALRQLSKIGIIQGHLQCHHWIECIEYLHVTDRQTDRRTYGHNDDMHVPR